MLNRIVLLCLLSKILETQYKVEKAIQVLLYHIKFHLGVGNRVCTNHFASPHIQVSPKFTSTGVAEMPFSPMYASIDLTM